MTDKIVAGLVTGVVAAPICAVCVLGPAAVGSVFAGAFGWLAGTGPIVTLALAIAVGWLTYRSIRRRRRREIRYATNEKQFAASKTDPPTRSVRTHSDRPRIGHGRSKI